MSEQIKPCANCTGSAKVITSGGRGEGFESIKWFAIQCSDCRICTAWSEQVEEVIKTWNRRPPREWSDEPPDGKYLLWRACDGAKVWFLVLRRNGDLIDVATCERLHHKGGQWSRVEE